ncbi:MAG: ABC transporter substrate-binding protein [Candidatus Rokuibacteriota bacterium]
MWRIAWILALWGLVGSPLPAPAQGAKDTLSVDLPGEPASLDPHVQWDTDSYHVYRNIFDNLLTRNPDGKIVPQLAKAWRYENDTTLVLDIRTDVKFHDGTPLTVDDVAWSVHRIIDPAFKSPQLSQFNSIVKAEAVGTDKVRLTTSSPYPALLAQLVKLSIVPRAYVQKVGNEKFNVEPMGSGPYRFVSWQKGVRVTLAANESYWRGRPPFKTVTFQMVPDTATRIANLKTGRADIIRQLNPDDAASLKGESRLQILSGPTERTGYLFINALAGPTKDVRVRRAIAHAINRQLLIDALLGGYGRPVTILLTPANFGYIDGMKGYPFDPTRARQLLKEAGAEGAEISFYTSPAYDQRLVQAIQQMLQEVGLKVAISQTDQPTFLKRRQGKPEEAGSISLGRWSCACQDADGVIFPLFHSQSLWAKYANPAFDDAVTRARQTLKDDERLKHYREAFAILEQDVPGIGLYQDFAIYAARRDLSWKPTANEAFFVMEMKWQ